MRRLVYPSVAVGSMTTTQPLRKPMLEGVDLRAESQVVWRGSWMSF
jgi:hypothetical protein